MRGPVLLVWPESGQVEACAEVWPDGCWSLSRDPVVPGGELEAALDRLGEWELGPVLPSGWRRATADETDTVESMVADLAMRGESLH